MQRASSSIGDLNEGRSDRESDEEILNRAFDELERETPDVVARAIEWLRNPKFRWVRIPTGLLFMAASFFWFLPIIGVEFFPIGLLLIAQDIPILRRPAGKLLLWLEAKWRKLKRWWRQKKSQGEDELPARVACNS